MFQHNISHNISYTHTYCYITRSYADEPLYYYLELLYFRYGLQFRLKDRTSSYFVICIPKTEPEMYRNSKHSSKRKHQKKRQQTAQKKLKKLQKMNRNQKRKSKKLNKKKKKKNLIVNRYRYRKNAHPSCSLRLKCKCKSNGLSWAGVLVFYIFLLI